MSIKHARIIDPFNPQRFWNKVDIRSDAECWPWIAHKRTDGYGVIKIGNRLVKAHRIAYMLANHRDPLHLVIDHTCFNKSCCNPAHLQAILQTENVARYYRSIGGPKATCRKGHGKTPGKQCKICQREYLALWRAAHRERVREISRKSYRKLNPPRI